VFKRVEEHIALMEDKKQSRKICKKNRKLKIFENKMRVSRQICYF